MEDNNERKDYFGVTRYPDEFMNNLNFEGDLEGLGITDQMLEKFEERKIVKNTKMFQEGFAKVFTYIKNGKVVLNKKAIAVALAAVATVSTASGFALGSAVGNSSHETEMIGITQALEQFEQPENRIFDEEDKEFLEEMKELNNVIETYKNNKTVENRIAAVKAVKDYREVSLKFLGNEYGYERLSYRNERSDGVIVVGVDKEGNLFEFNGPSYVKDAVRAASAIDYYNGDGSSEKWDNEMNGFIKQHETMNSAVNRACQEKISESVSVEAPSK